MPFQFMPGGGFIFTDDNGVPLQMPQRQAREPARPDPNRGFYILPNGEIEMAFVRVAREEAQRNRASELLQREMDKQQKLADKLKLLAKQRELKRGQKRKPAHKQGKSYTTDYLAGKTKQRGLHHHTQQAT